MFASANGVRGPTNIRNWLRLKGLRANDLAKAVHVAPALVSGWLRGKRRPDSVRRRAIEIVTGGAVTTSDWDKASEVKYLEKLRVEVVTPSLTPDRETAR